MLQAIHDSLRAADTAIVQSPLPKGPSVVLRAVLNTPQWMQIVAVVIAAIIALAIAVVLWKRRHRIITWLTTRSRGWKIGMIGVGAVVLIGAAGAGMVSWKYMMHDNDFCVSCHVMTPAFQKFQLSEHKNLSCHDCHRQSIFASARQLYYWVAERPLEIPVHAKVPTKVCSECHVQDKPDSAWKRIVATAGHRVHLSSDSSALKNVQCVTCHGAEVHHFAPIDQTCGQAGCHENVTITLGKMKGQTSMHCTGCHAFTAPVSETISVDSTKKSLVPTETQCMSCHEMRERMPGFDPLADPHKGSCGSCHNAHKQTTPAEAFQTCTNAGCHAGPDTITAFHKGLGSHALANCGSCHRAHDWKAKGTSCISCHTDIYNDRAAAKRAATIETRAPVQLASLGLTLPSSWTPRPHEPLQGGGAGKAPFSHRRHRDVECTACHNSGRKHGELTVNTATECQSCHHAADGAMRDLKASAAGKRGCASCHEGAELARARRVTASVTMTVWKEPKQRTLSFEHTKHRALECKSCHTTPVTLVASKTCASCHGDHHEATSTCSACHTQARDVHKRVAHEGCAGSGCHTDQATLALPNKRNVCEGCHTNLVTHKPGKECAQCHQVKWTPTARAAGLQ